MPFKTADELRAAVNAGNYRAVDRLLVELRRQVEATWPTVAAEERQSLATQILALLAWARQIAIVRRAHVQGTLNQITRNRAYVSANAQKNARLELEG